MNLQNLYSNNLIFVLAKKEIRALYRTPVLYAAALVFVFGAGIFFIGSDYWFNAGLSDFRTFFLNMPFLFCVMVPMLTMNIWADEKKQYTDKFLFSLPVPLRTIVLGKYLSLICIWFCILTLSMIIPASVFSLGDFGAGSFFVSYCAVLFFGAGVFSVSCALSAISRHSAINFLLSFLTVFFFTVTYTLVQKTALPQYIKNILQYFSFPYHFESAARGIFDLRDFVFYCILTAFGIELNVFVLHEQRNTV